MIVHQARELLELLPAPGRRTRAAVVEGGAQTRDDSGDLGEIGRRIRSDLDFRHGTSGNTRVSVESTARGAAQAMSWPPSTTMTWPVMRSLPVITERIAAAMSSGSETRRSGLRPSKCFLAGS